MRVIDPSGVARCTRSADRSAKYISEIFENAKRLGSAKTTATADYEIGIFESGALAGFGDGVGG